MFSGYGRLSTPRARGSPYLERARAEWSWVDPACAGIPPTIISPAAIAASRPRVRGDPPAAPGQESRGEGSTPRARGSPGDPPSTADPPEVDPACAGIPRQRVGPCGLEAGRPRVRGDPPPTVAGSTDGPTSTPRARGSPASRRIRLNRQTVDPACAGIPRSPPAGRREWPRRPRVRGDPPGLGCGWLRPMASSSRPRACGILLGQCSGRAVIASEPYTDGESSVSPGGVPGLRCPYGDESRAAILVPISAADRKATEGKPADRPV